jgi:hypothetical protein
MTLGGALVLAAACSGSSTQPGTKAPALDPYITIRVLNHLDTTTKAGRASWRVFALLSGPQVNQNGLAPQGTYTITDARFNHPLMCIAAGADSIGQRLIAPFAIGDTINEVLQPSTATDSIVARWYAGNHNPAAGYIILTITPTDAWDSPQFVAGHGLTPNDPIKWAWDWTGSGTATFAERTLTDTASCNHA